MKVDQKQMKSHDVTFSESYAVAQSQKSSWTRLASTYGCMRVILSRETLTIKPHWFAKWPISLLRLDLCHEIPITHIKNVNQTGQWFGYGKVEIQFATVEGKDEESILLYLKGYREFIANLKDVIGR